MVVPVCVGSEVVSGSSLCTVRKGGPLVLSTVENSSLYMSEPPRVLPVTLPVTR